MHAQLFFALSFEFDPYLPYFRVGFIKCLSASLSTHTHALSLSLSGEKHYKREKLLVSNSQWRRWPQLWGGKEPENNSKWSQGRINGPVLAQSSEGLLNLTDMYINTQHFYWIRGWKRENEKYEYSSSFIFQGISSPTGGQHWFWPISIPITEMTAFTPGPWQRSGPVHRRSGEEGVGACSQLSTNTH